VSGALEAGYRVDFIGAGCEGLAGAARLPVRTWLAGRGGCCNDIV
jgi:hypothetical protein